MKSRSREGGWLQRAGARALPGSPRARRADRAPPAARLSSAQRSAAEKKPKREGRPGEGRPGAGRAPAAPARPRGGSTAPISAPLPRDVLCQRPPALLPLRHFSPAERWKRAASGQTRSQHHLGCHCSDTDFLPPPASSGIKQKFKVAVVFTSNKIILMLVPNWSNLQFSVSR